MAAVPFGFSVGDFVAGVELVHKAAKALRSVSGATEQYQQTLLDLSLIESVLRRVQVLTPASDETIRTVQLCSLACHVPLDRFLNKIRKLERQLNFELHPHATSILGIKKGSHKLQWAIILEQDVAKLKASISPSIDIINTLLQVESLERGASTQEGLQRILGQTGGIIPALDKVTAVLQRNATMEKHIQHILPVLTHLTHQVSHLSTAHQVHSIKASFTDLTGKADQNASRNQVNDLTLLAERIKADQHHDNYAISTLISLGMQELAESKQIAEASKCMLVTLVNQLPNGSTAASHDTTLLAHNSTNQRQSSAKAAASHSRALGAILQGLLEALRHGLNAILLCLLCATPFLQACFRSINSISRAPRMLLDSNITFVDALNREFSLQFQQFRYWSVVSAWLQCQFQDCLRALRISRGRFAMFKNMRFTGRGVMIPFEDWERTIGPGQRVLMSMYVGHQDPAQGHWPLRNACSSCGFVDAYLHRTSIWTKCADCGQLFLLHDLEVADCSSTHDIPASQQRLTCDEPDVFDSAAWQKKTARAAKETKHTTTQKNPSVIAIDYALAEVDLVREAVKALRGLPSHTAARQHAIRDLQILEAVLRGVQEVSLESASEETVMNLRYCSHFCRPPLNGFLRRPKELEPDICHTLACGESLDETNPAPVWIARLKSKFKVLQGSNSGGSSHYGDKYFFNGAPPIALIEAMSKKPDGTGGMMQIGQLVSNGEDLRVMLPQSVAFTHVENDYSSEPSTTGSANVRSLMPQSPDQSATELTKLLLQCLLELARKKLNAILATLLWAIPTFRASVRSLNALARQPSMLLDSNITLIDALNREVSLPYQWFRKWSHMLAHLQYGSRGTPGQYNV
ncbi:hypothetical protein MBLNU13_g01135t2 [Cladosporium sp. NU13]